MDFQKKAEELYSKYGPVGFDHPEGLYPMKEALIQTWNEAIEKSAEIIDSSQKYRRGLDGYEWIECLKNPKMLAQDIRGLKVKINL